MYNSGGKWKVNVDLGWVKLQITQYITIYEHGIIMPSISFIAGICLYLRKDDSKLYWYNCSHFQQGCPQENYKASTIYERKFELNYKASGSGSVFF